MEYHEPYNKGKAQVTVNSKQISSFFDYQAQTWDDKPADIQSIQQIMNFCDLKAGQRILDVACGTGVLFNALLAYSPEIVLGVDISEQMVKKAMGKIKDNRIQVVAQDFLELDAKGIDRVVIFNAYPHFFDKNNFAKKVFKVLRPGGRFTLAHSMGRKRINAVHDKRYVRNYSTTIHSADTEKCWFEPWFNIDKCVDIDDLYLISGTKPYLKT